MTPASTDTGESAATPRPAAAAITRASFPAMKVIFLYLFRIFGLKTLPRRGAVNQRECNLLVPNKVNQSVGGGTRAAWSILNRSTNFESFNIGFEKQKSPARMPGS
jgi:hypothetical protein